MSEHDGEPCKKCGCCTCLHPPCPPSLTSTGETSSEDVTQEKVDHPSHYGGSSNPYEAIKIIEALGWGEGFNKGNALKYLIRAGKKPGQPELQDLEKAF